MTNDKKTWFKSLPKWLQWLVSVLVGFLVSIGLVTGYGLTSCGNTKVMLRNAQSATISQQGSDIEVTVSASVDSASVKWNRKE